MTMTNTICSIELGKTLDVLIEKAKGLRSAGVSNLAMGSISINLLPEEATDPGVKRSEPEQKDFADPLDDPASYGGGVVPGFKRLREDQGGIRFETEE